MNNSLNRKRCLARARGGDYVHPGEEEAIDMVMRKFPKDNSRTILDIGCGLGGTAQYIKSHGYGSPVCIDKDASCIEYVNASYPELETHASDVIELKQLLKNRQFDLAYLFNSFYAFSDQQGSLKVISELVKSNGHLVIFEYMTDTEYTGTELFNLERTEFTPVRKDNVAQLLSNAGWELEDLVDLSSEYIRWYESLLINFEKSKGALIKEIGIDTFEANQQSFSKLLTCLKSGEISGCIVYAKKST